MQKRASTVAKPSA